ncbi:MAG: lipoprotein signal peptidase [Gammaproteobacteria bacterium]|nr:lipoprotein signal peptidase [Gammaproteobacteria bacterium]
MLSWLWLSLLVLVLDQLTKYLADTGLDYAQPVALIPQLNLLLLYNPGAAFSFLSDASGWQRWFFVVIGVVISTVLLFWMRGLSRADRRVAIALALVLGGAIGNIVDRLLHGYVIDFIDVYYNGWHWPAFNIADSAITVGVVLLLVDSIKTQDSSDGK